MKNEIDEIVATVEIECCPRCTGFHWRLQTIKVRSEDEFRQFLEAICVKCGFRMIVKEL